MKTSMLSFVLAISLLSVAAARAADPAKPLSTQQNKMVTCNAQATEKSLKGDERKTFMADCLKAEKASGNAQHQKMKDCNKQATGKKGAERNAFMKECLTTSKS